MIDPDRRVALALARRGDVALALLVVAIVGMMILPLPTWLLDLLITTNIAVSTVLLLVAIYVHDAIRFASFPTLLLLTTLYRLALNVSSTRLILLQADAGEVIGAFGRFVVAGNFVVGAVVFLILTIVLFLVIAKGAERVAEVAARFTLDAMPGRQMAIDADLRAGAIDMDEARRRRTALQRESQLYGAMDGAMKFVKGDAVASILITVINIAGGLLIGVLQRGLPAGEAVRVYSVLTIGDGLVSQIPSLITSMAAGLIVTRVASEDEGAHLGQEIGAQILAQPKAIAIAACLLVGLAIVPGMPAVPFLLLGAVAGATAWGLLRGRRGEWARAERIGATRPRALAGGFDRLLGEGADDALAPPAALSLDVGADLAASFGEGAGRLAYDLLPKLREELFADLGVPIPPVRVRPGAADPLGFALRLYDVPVASGAVVRDRLADAGADVCARLRAALRRHAHELLDIQKTQDLLEALERTHPALVREVVPKLVSPVLMTDILRRLVEEGVAVRNLRDIVQALADFAQTEKDPVVLTEHVRASLRRWITWRHTAGAPGLPVWLLDPSIEEAVRGAIQHTPTGNYLALEPELSGDILRAARASLDGNAGGAVVLTAQDVRRYVRRLLEVELPDVTVLSYQELTPETQVQPLGRISVGSQ